MTTEKERQTANLTFEDEQDQAYWVRFSTMLAIAVVIATVGLYRHAGALVSAAMLIAPLMTPILGIASSLVKGLTRRLLYLLTAVAIASVGNVVLAYVLIFVADAPRGMTIPSEVMARTDPGLEELMVALAAGIAGAYVQERKADISLLPGVAIGVSLVPPLSAAGILLFFGESRHAWEATLLYLTNLAAIVLSACAVFLLLGMRPAVRDSRHVVRVSLGTAITFGILVVIAIQLTTVTLERFRQARDKEQVVAAVRAWAGENPVEIIRLDVFGKEPKTLELWLMVDAPFHHSRTILPPVEQIAPGLDIKDLYGALAQVLGPDANLVARAQLRYSGVVQLKTGKVLGLPPSGGN